MPSKFNVPETTEITVRKKRTLKVPTGTYPVHIQEKIWSYGVQQLHVDRVSDEKDDEKAYDLIVSDVIPQFQDGAWSKGKGGGSRLDSWVAPCRAILYRNGVERKVVNKIKTPADVERVCEERGFNAEKVFALAQDLAEKMDVSGAELR